MHEASYGSAVGEDTDLFHWPGKFSTQMDAILALKLQDERLAEGQKNHVVAFKSCFPNNMFTGQGTAPGNAAGRAHGVEREGFAQRRSARAREAP